ncbi:hypothetical protein DUI87_30319 [Hirundo rustica rustica]|uniref:Uncharacterized protein n=1 Tax=Hirundo rustica rustica TaxID=333673 RepID=A0A3M0IWM1_HIRRU|nr:hypothetical protein DUI87_30319 [Hirundo rustica rustica]
MTSECESLGALMTDEELQIPCKQKENSAEGNSDEIYESSPGTDATPGLGPPQPTGFTLPVPRALLSDQAEINPAKTNTMPQGQVSGKAGEREISQKWKCSRRSPVHEKLHLIAHFHLLLGEKCRE